MAVTAEEPRMVPRMVWGRRNFQKASLKATIFWAALRPGGPPRSPPGLWRGRGVGGASGGVGWEGEGEDGRCGTDHS